MLIRFIIVFAVATLLSLCLTPWVIRFAIKIGAIDRPNERKIHSRPIPRLGGIAIYFSFLLTLLSFVLFDPTPFSTSWMASQQGLMLIGSLLLVLTLGIWDDLRSLGPGQKFIVQIVAATIAYLAGFRISSITDPLGGPNPLVLGILDYPATLLWIVGISNAFNLIDGLDGLASGVAIIASLTIGAIAWLNGDAATAFPVFILAGALFGFLRYNFNPAKIFLGDSGSLFVGFALATLSMQSSTKGSTAFAILIPVLSLGLPIMDTLLSMMRRFLGSLVPENLQSGSLGHKLKGMFLPDKKHIHHQLLARGLSQRKAVLILYSVSCLFGLGAFAVTIANNLQASLLLVVVAITTVVGIRQLQYREMAILKNGVLLPMYEWPVIHRSIFQVFLDLAFCSAAFILAYYLSGPETPVSGEGYRFSFLLTLVCGIQIAVFAFSGLYRGMFRFLGIGDLLKIVQTVGVAVLVTGIALTVLPHPWNVINVRMLVIDFYFLLTLIAGSRGSFHVLNFLFRRESNGGKGILIYGANTKGVFALQQILYENHSQLTPLGFLDDTPQLEGKQINGYPVFGGHLKIPSLVKRYKIDQVLISNGDPQPEVLRRLKEFSEQYGFSLRRSKILMEDISSRSERTRKRTIEKLVQETAPHLSAP